MILKEFFFLTLFPDGKGDPTDNATFSEIAKSTTEAFASKLKHLVKFPERINGNTGRKNEFGSNLLSANMVQICANCGKNLSKR